MRARQPRVTQTGLSLLAAFLREAGAKVATAEVRPDGTYKVVTMDGAYLISPKDGEANSWSDLKAAE